MARIISPRVIKLLELGVEQKNLRAKIFSLEQERYEVINQMLGYGAVKIVTAFFSFPLLGIVSIGLIHRNQVFGTFIPVFWLSAFLAAILLIASFRAYLRLKNLEEKLGWQDAELVKMVEAAKGIKMEISKLEAWPCLQGRQTGKLKTCN